MSLQQLAREHLELAALAAGIELTYRRSSGVYYYDDPETGREEWRPHTDPGDAARLAVRLDMSVDVDGSTAFAHIDGYEEMDDCGYGAEEHDGTEPDKLRAYCEAITLCAAQIGKRMREGGR